MCLIDFNWYSTLFSFKESVISTQVNFVLKSKKDKGYLHLLPYIFTYTQIFFYYCFNMYVCCEISVSLCVYTFLFFVCAYKTPWHWGEDSVPWETPRHQTRPYTWKKSDWCSTPHTFVVSPCIRYFCNQVRTHLH